MWRITREEEERVEPVLFLDIDGVLNSLEFRNNHPELFEIGCDGSLWFDKEKCALLERLIKETGAVIVISSSWRTFTKLEDIVRFLHTRGVPSAKVIGATPDLDCNKPLEIQQFLLDNPEIKVFAVVDDDEALQVFNSRFVQTTWEQGLQESHVKELIKLLSA